MQVLVQVLYCIGHCKSWCVLSGRVTFQTTHVFQNMHHDKTCFIFQFLLLHIHLRTYVLDTQGKEEHTTTSTSPLHPQQHSLNGLINPTCCLLIVLGFDVDLIRRLPTPPASLFLPHIELPLVNASQHALCLRRMGCNSSSLHHVDDSVQVGLKRAKKTPMSRDGPDNFVPSSLHPSIKLKQPNGTAEDDTSTLKADSEIKETGQ